MPVIGHRSRPRSSVPAGAAEIAGHRTSASPPTFHPSIANLCPATSRFLVAAMATDRPVSDDLRAFRFLNLNQTCGAPDVIADVPHFLVRTGEGVGRCLA